MLCSLDILVVVTQQLIIPKTVSHDPRDGIFAPVLTEYSTVINLTGVNVEYYYRLILNSIRQSRKGPINVFFMSLLFIHDFLINYVKIPMV